MSEITINAKDYHQGNPEMPDSTMWGVVKQIMVLDRNAPDFEEQLKGKIKRLVHYEKLSTYHRVKLWNEMFQDKESLTETLELKIQTHSEWAKKSNKDIWTSG